MKTWKRLPIPKGFVLVAVIFLQVLLAVVAQASNSQPPESFVCIVYFTYTHCPNCKVTDPIVLGEWFKEKDNLVIVEYMFESWDDPNAKLLGEYANKYGSFAAVPQVFVSEEEIALGRLDVPKLIGKLKALKENECLLLEDSVPFQEMDLNSVEGEPLKVWANGRLLVRLKKHSNVSSEFLRELLFTNNLTRLIQSSPYPIKFIEPKPAPIAFGEIHFKNAILIGDSWVLKFNQTISAEVRENRTTLQQNVTKNETTIEVELPLLGKVSAENLSLPLLTVLIAGADGFNPCAFFILTFLLSTVLLVRSRKRIVIVGAIFVFFSGLIYFLFMAAWLNVFMFASQLKILTIVAGCIALFAGIVNVKDYFFFKKGISLTLPTSHKLSFMEKVESLARLESLFPLVVATSILAITVNMYELLCTVGFPIVYIRILTLHNLPTFQYYLYLIFYNVVYVVPLACIVTIFALTLGERRFTESGVRKLKLISGYMISLLGVALLFKPHLLENVVTTFGLLALALGMGGATFLLHKLLRGKAKF